MRNPNPLPIALLLFSFSFLSAQTSTFNSSGTFTVPAGVTLIRVECWGGGGSGGAPSIPPGTGKGGGGGGAYAMSMLQVTPGESFAVTVGLGGSLGNDGGNSIFGANEVVAVGGLRAINTTGGEGGRAADCAGEVVFSGGDGANSGMSTGGGGGGSAFFNANGGNGSGTTGGDGAGDGGDGGLQGNNPGNPGIAPGGGGGGKSGGMGLSASGAPGRVKISWGTALPVTWLSFRAALEGDDVQLHWSTASESNNEGFAVQRSENGRDWQALAFVQGAGTSSEVQNYSYPDNTLSTLNSQLAYYRLAQRDYDGTTDYSPIRVVELGAQGGIRVFPNPAGEVVTVAFAQPTEARGYVRLLNGNGRLLAEHAIPVGTTEYQLRVAQFPAGTYLLEVKAGVKEWSRRLVVE